MGIQTVNSINHNSKLSKQIFNDIADNNLSHQETKSIDIENAQEIGNEYESNLSYLDGEIIENSIDQFDSWISLNDSDSCKTIPKSSSKIVLESEMIGVGTNKNVNLFKTIFYKQYLFFKYKIYRYIL